jgi:hypothetical protein
MLALKNQCSLDEKHPVLRVGDAEGAANRFLATQSFESRLVCTGN